jgi:alpha-L-fucosidase 2
MKNPVVIFFASLLQFTFLSAHAQISTSKLSFKSLPTSWDEGLPLGNGMLGALIWQKDGNTRFSLDRADLWDQRPMNGLHRNEFSFAWVQQQVQKKDYTPVQDYFDKPYDNEPAPTKIPGAALEIPFEGFGNPIRAEIILRSALALVEFESGINIRSFVIHH